MNNGEESDPELRYCPIQVGTHESSIVMGGEGYTRSPEKMICPENCPGPQEIDIRNRALRLIFGSGRIACGLKGVTNRF